MGCVTVQVSDGLARKFEVVDRSREVLTALLNVELPMSAQLRLDDLLMALRHERVELMKRVVVELVERAGPIGPPVSETDEASSDAALQQPCGGLPTSSPTREAVPAPRGVRWGDVTAQELRTLAAAFPEGRWVIASESGATSGRRG